MPDAVSVAAKARKYLSWALPSSEYEAEYRKLGPGLRQLHVDTNDFWIDECEEGKHFVKMAEKLPEMIESIVDVIGRDVAVKFFAIKLPRDVVVARDGPITIFTMQDIQDGRFISRIDVLFEVCHA